MRITIPLMQEAYKYCLIIAITGGLNSFAVMNIMTGGGPGTASYTLTYLMYRSAFVVNKVRLRLRRGGAAGRAEPDRLFCVNKFIAREQIIY